MLRVLAGPGGFALIALALTDGFNTIVLPRRVRHIFRLTGLFYRVTWTIFGAVARRIPNGSRREDYLSIYGPLSLLMLLTCWAIALILGFGLLQWSVGLALDHAAADLGSAIYVSASSLLMTVVQQPDNSISRWLMTIETGLGFGFLGLVVGYLPVLYQSYSSRELRISLLDARAGSPPSAGDLLARQARHAEKLEQQLATWEEWSAELLEEQLSYPMLAYFRSQHQNQSWLAALTTLLDASAVVFLCSEDELKLQARLTFAIGRHALVDLATVFRAKPAPPPDDRLPTEQLAKLREKWKSAKICLRLENLTDVELKRMREMYEPYAQSLSRHFLIALPAWLTPGGERDNWLATSWDRPPATFAVSDPFQHDAGESDAA